MTPDAARLAPPGARPSTPPPAPPPTPRRAGATWRDGRDELFAEPPRLTAGRRRAGGLHRACRSPPTTRRCASTSALEAAEPQRLEVPTAADGVVAAGPDRRGHPRRARPARRVVAGAATAAGSSCRCATGSAGAATYGGGRYLLDTVKGADLGGDGGRLVVDLNFAYHPSCTYDPRWSCPLAPEGNRIDAPVAAGEQLPPGGWYWRVRRLERGRPRGRPRRRLGYWAKIGSVDSARASEISPCMERLVGRRRRGRSPRTLANCEAVDLLEARLAERPGRALGGAAQDQRPVRAGLGELGQRGDPAELAPAAPW